MSEKKEHEPTQEDLNLKSRHLDPEHDNYWKARGHDARPEDWRERVEAEKKRKS